MQNQQELKNISSLFKIRTLSTDSSITNDQHFKINKIDNNSNSENFEKFPCSLCKKFFLSKSAQQAHIKFVHQKINLLYCPYLNCKKSFNNKYRLEIHINKHKGLKLFKCKICNRQFTEQGTLIRHYVTHNEEKPFMCNICFYKSKTNSQMRHHYKFIHNDEKYYKCKFCDKKYCKKAELKHHLNLHEKILIDKEKHYFKPKIIIDDCNKNDNFSSNNLKYNDSNMKIVNEIVFGVFYY